MTITRDQLKDILELHPKVSDIGYAAFIYTDGPYRRLVNMDTVIVLIKNPAALSPATIGTTSELLDFVRKHLIANKLDII
jgi:hypothetical protein